MRHTLMINLDCGFRSYPAGHSNLKPATIPG